MSLSLTKPLDKYSRANEQGEIEFSKLGLLPRKSQAYSVWDLDDFDQSYALGTYYRLRFVCPKFTYTLHFSDVSFATTDSWSEDPAQADFNGKFMFELPITNFSVPDFIATLQASVVGQYFDIEYSILAHPHFSFTLTAKEASADFDLSIFYDYGSTGFITTGAGQTNFVTYSAAHVVDDYKLHLRVLVENDDQPDIFTEVYSIFHTTGTIEGGRTIFTFREVPFILRQNMSFNAIKNPYRILIDKDVIRKYKVEYWESWTGATTPVRSMPIANQYAIASAIDRKKEHVSSAPIVHLNNTSLHPHIAPGQPAWFSFLITEELAYGYQDMRIDMTYSVGSGTQTRTLSGPYYYLSHSNIIHIPVWLGLDTTENVNWVECTLTLIDPNASQANFNIYQKYYIDQKYYAVDKWYYYLNSLGGIDSIRLYGSSDDSLNFNFSDYETLRSRADALSQGFASRFSSNSVERTKGLSGWIDRDMVDTFKDFCYSRFIYEVDRERIPTALPTGEYLPYGEEADLMYLSIRHTLEAMISHKCLIVSKELPIPKASESLVSFKIDIDKAVSELGIISRNYPTPLPELYEDILEFTCNEEHINKFGAAILVSGYMALPKCYINGVEVEPINSTGLAITPEYGYKEITFTANSKNLGTHVRIVGNYMRDVKVIYIGSQNGTIVIHRASFYEVRNFEMHNLAGYYIERTTLLWRNNWRTLNTLRLYKLTQIEAEKLFLAIHDQHNVNASTGLNHFSEVNVVGTIAGSGITSPTGSRMDIIRNSLTAKGIVSTI